VCLVWWSLVPRWTVTNGRGLRSWPWQGMRRRTSTAAVWTLDALTEAANAQGITVRRSQVRRILLADGARWRQVRSWAVSKDPDFVPNRQPSSICTPAHLSVHTRVADRTSPDPAGVHRRRTPAGSTCKNPGGACSAGKDSPVRNSPARPTSSCHNARSSLDADKRPRWPPPSSTRKPSPGSGTPATTETNIS
jgi:hypothetical protein